MPLFAIMTSFVPLSNLQDPQSAGQALDFLKWRFLFRFLEGPNPSTKVKKNKLSNLPKRGNENGKIIHLIGEDKVDILILIKHNNAYVASL